MVPLTLPGWHRLARHLSRAVLAALLLATLAPAISRALAGGPHGERGWVELCTPQGMQWVETTDLVDGPSPAPTAPDQNALDLCGHCTLAAERFAPLLPVMPVVVAVATPWGHPDTRSFDPVSLAAPQPAARGPPFLC